MADDVAYQQAAQVRQLLAERANALAYGQQTRVDAAEKQLAGLGVDLGDEPEKRAPEPAAPDKEPPKARATKQERQQTTGKAE